MISEADSTWSCSTLIVASILATVSITGVSDGSFGITRCDLLATASHNCRAPATTCGALVMTSDHCTVFNTPRKPSAAIKLLTNFLFGKSLPRQSMMIKFGKTTLPAVTPFGHTHAHISPPARLRHAVEPLRPTQAVHARGEAPVPPGLLIIHRPTLKNFWRVEKLKVFSAKSKAGSIATVSATAARVISSPGYQSPFRCR